MKVRLLNNNGRPWFTEGKWYEVLNVKDLIGDVEKRLYLVKDDDGDRGVLVHSDVQVIHEPITLSPEEIKQQEELFYEAAYWG